jgi:hypothetical protein
LFGYDGRKDNEIKKKKEKSDLSRYYSTKTKKIEMKAKTEVRLQLSLLTKVKNVYFLIV